MIQARAYETDLIVRTAVIPVGNASLLAWERTIQPDGHSRQQVFRSLRFEFRPDWGPAPCDS